MKKSFFFTLQMIILFNFVKTFGTSAQAGIIWGKQLGTEASESGIKMASDTGGNVFMTGNVNRAINGEYFGNEDGYIMKMDNDGEILWSAQFGTSEKEYIFSITTDVKGNCYVTGYTKGNFAADNPGGDDIILVKYSPDGKQLMKKQFGTVKNETGSHVFLDEYCNIFIVGYTEGDFANKNTGNKDGFVLKLDSMGNEIFNYQFGTDQEELCNGIVLDKSLDIYLCGTTSGNLNQENYGQGDGFIMKLGKEGSHLWTKLYGTKERDGFVSILIDKEDKLYIGGTTSGDFATQLKGKEGEEYKIDGIIIKLDLAGEIIWKKQFGSEYWDVVWGMALSPDPDASIAISGCQGGEGFCKSYCRLFDKNGEQLWVQKLSSRNEKEGTCGKGLCIDPDGNIFHIGNTGANLFGTNKGGRDVFVVKLKSENDNE